MVIVNNNINLETPRRRFLTDNETFELAKMNGANRSERLKLVRYNQNFKEKHVFSADIFKELTKERRRISYERKKILRELKLSLVCIYWRYCLVEGYYDGSDTETDIN